jgi:hypothetical protein
MVPPYADGTDLPKERDHFSSPAHTTEDVASIPEGDDLIHSSTAELYQRPLKRLNGFMDVSHNSDPHWRTLCR